MENLPLKYLGYGITFQEVPNEVSLVINISGCPHKCDGCHSEYLWEYEGRNISKDIDDIIKSYDGMFTCVCIMGGDQNTEELYYLFNHIKELGYKTCLYSGLDSVQTLKDLNLDYLKIGKYNYLLGGLDSIKTNQIFYTIKDGEFINTTYMFQN